MSASPPPRVVGPRRLPRSQWKQKGLNKREYERVAREDKKRYDDEMAVWKSLPVADREVARQKKGKGGKKKKKQGNAGGGQPNDLHTTARGELKPSTSLKSMSSLSSDSGDSVVER